MKANDWNVSRGKFAKIDKFHSDCTAKVYIILELKSLNIKTQNKTKQKAERLKRLEQDKTKLIWSFFKNKNE